MIEPYYSDKYTTIYKGDCRNILPLFPACSFDLLLTDPPYGIKADKGVGGFGSSKTDRHYTVSWDSSRPEATTFGMMLRVSKRALIFGGNYFADLLPPSKRWVVWDKKGDVKFKNPYSDCELIWTNFPKNTVKKYVFKQQGFITDSKDKRVHPTPKPSELVAWLLSAYSISGSIVIDPYLGSGTTAVASSSVGNKCVGIEISEEYCEIAANRCMAQTLDMLQKGEY